MKLPILAISLLIALSQLAHSADRSVIVRFKQRPGAVERAMVRRAEGKVRRSHLIVPAMTVVLPEEKIERLRKNPRVAYVEENAIYTIAATGPLARELSNAWGVEHISASVAHAQGNKGAGVKVAILDTGIDYTHPDLDGNYAGGYDFVFDDDDPLDDSFASHGTHVAGILAAEENGRGMIGVAPQAQILAVKVLDGAGFGTEDWIIAGIEWAVLNGADIINLSVQGPGQIALQEACDAARDAGVLLVAAGGNSLAGQGPAYPAAYDSVIAVNATDLLDLPADFSPVGEAIELAAPGVNIYSTVAGGTYARLSGTSQAAPFVSGTAALYLANGIPDLSGDGLVDGEDARWLLLLTATDLGDVGRDRIFGYGLVDANYGVFGDGDGMDAWGQVHIDRAAGRNGVVTIRGSGFGVYTRRSGTAVRGRFRTVQDGRVTVKYVNGTIASWDNERIVVRWSSRLTPSHITVRSVFGKATATVSRSRRG